MRQAGVTSTVDITTPRDFAWASLGSPWSARNLGDVVLSSARRHPGRAALWVDGTALTYGDLIASAAGIAGALHVEGRAARQCRCAILGSRSVSVYLGIIGAAMAHAVYIPLNPRHPRERLRFMLAAADVDAIVVDRDAIERARDLLRDIVRPVLVLLPDAASVPDWAITLDRHRFLCARDLASYRPALAAATDAPVSDRDGAYLLFTSGSTGNPKGVFIRQGNVLAYLRHVTARYQPREDDRFTQLFDLTFDLSVHDMFLCWGAGATLYCPPDRARISPREFVRQHALTFWFSAPSTAAFMMRLHALGPGDFPSLRWSLFCGEALPKRLALTWAAAAPNAVLENLYGPTEATIAITAYRLPDAASDRDRLPDILPIGASFPGQQTCIIDDQGRVVAAAEAGELCLSGSQVAEGYWQLPALTADRFISLPDSLPGQCWYRTGDRAIVTQDGLVLLGRLDRQIKIGGHRVELQDVEAALRRAADCDTVAAIAWPVDDDGLVRGIVGFVPLSAVPTDAIQSACRRTLPPYMVPARVCRLREWPVNDNGKTDYRRLYTLVES